MKLTLDRSRTGGPAGFRMPTQPPERRSVGFFCIARAFSRQEVCRWTRIDYYSRYRELQSYVGWTDADAERIVAAAPLLEPYLHRLDRRLLRRDRAASRRRAR